MRDDNWNFCFLLVQHPGFRSVCVHRIIIIFQVNPINYYIGGWPVRKKNLRSIVPSLNRNKKLNANSAMPRYVFEAEEFRFYRDLQLFLNKMKSGVDQIALLVRGTLRLPKGREAQGKGSRPSEPNPHPTHLVPMLHVPSFPRTYSFSEPRNV